MNTTINRKKFLQESELQKQICRDFSVQITDAPKYDSFSLAASILILVKAINENELSDP